MPRQRIKVQGVVQGVGFRPFVYRLAQTHGLTGWVRNQPDGVVMEVQGSTEALSAFMLGLMHEKPAPAQIQQLVAEPMDELAEASGFFIHASGEGPRRPSIPADLATCPECLAEVMDPRQRRHRYPFTNCTHCGPRFSIITSLPYDRPRTTMAPFPLCPECAREYGDVLDRRFHAQPIACPRCGPTLRWVDGQGQCLAEGEQALGAAAQALRQGRVVALKGVGGYQLLVDATSPQGVARLRKRKAREEKPFAVMFPSLASLENACEVEDGARALLTGPEAPIVLLPRKPGADVAPGVAPGNPRLGAFLPYTPLHHLLLADVGRPVVCTSGNVSEEPMAIDNDEALSRLAPLADCFLMHDRRVARPVDDSVLRLDAHGPVMLRRARGFAPLAHPFPYEGAPILALGAHQKATICLLLDGHMVVSQHLGDLTTMESRALLRRTVDDLLDFFQARPGHIACDLHPDYATTLLARELAQRWDVPCIQVQHHHAHGAAVMAELGLEGPLLALAWDGTGLGSDGTMWGGEALRIDRRSCQRIGHLKPFRLPGGESAARDPRRSALGLIMACFGAEEADGRALSWIPPVERKAWISMVDRGINAPVTSSMGRLFDGVSALLGVRRSPGYEGQAAMELEWACEGAGNGHPHAWSLTDGVADPTSLLAALLQMAPGAAAAQFHRALADLALAWAQQAGLADVALCGGCFQNAQLLALVRAQLQQAGFKVHIPRAFPPNDGAISLGQAAVVAWKKTVTHRDQA